MSILDRWLAGIAPGVAARRAAHRLQLERIQKLRGYEGAGLSRRTEHWRTPNRDANAEITPALALLRSRSRDLRMNNPYASAAIESIIDNTVGYGIKPAPRGRTARITKAASAAWKAWAESTQCDYSGQHDIYGLQALGMGSIAEGGEVLLRRHWRKSSTGLALPFQIQVLEGDFLDTSKTTELASGSRVIAGVQFSKSGQREGYWLFPEHPGSQSMRLTAASAFVPAADVLHIYRMDRPGQVRGVPWAAPVMLRLRNFDEVEDAYIEREKIAACFAAFVTNQEAGDPGSPKQIALSERIEPGMIDFLPPGTSVEFASPPGVSGYKDFSWINLHAIAAGFGVPYEIFGDLSGVNFSSGRMGWQNYQRRIERWQWQMFIPGMCAGVWQWFNEAAVLAGVLPEDCPAEHVPPRRMMVNPKEEYAAMKEALRNGFETWGATLRALGYDPETQAEEIELFNALLDKHGLKLDCDPRFALPAGSAGATAPAPAPAPAAGAET